MRFGGRRAAPESLLDARKVDLVAESATGEIEMVIIQAGDWTGSDEQLQSFQDKVQTYVSFAVDGQLASQFPEAAGGPWVIAVRSLAGPLDARTSGVIDVLCERLVSYGGSIRTG